MEKMFDLDAYSPKEVAARVEAVGVTKARLPLLQMVMLGLLAGGYIGMGGLFSTLVSSDPALTFGIARLLGGVTFSFGLIMVVVAGAELFTGNNLLAMAWAERKITTGELAYNWLVVGLSNFFGAAGLALIVYLSHHPEMNAGGVALQYVKLAAAKCALPFWEAFLKGMLCNFLVCIAVWMAMAGRTVTDRVLAIVFPISAFVAAGFEHSIANMYFIPLGLLLKDAVPVPVAGIEMLTMVGFARNIVPVVLGNIVGGSLLVALVYYVIYRHGQPGNPP